MKLKQITSQHRRDVWYDAECEECGFQQKNVSGYDDRNYWDNVLPDKKCEKCGKSTNDINQKIRQRITTKYREGLQL
jgi:Zn ribbon nucleic-acid-binding protein